MNKSAMDLFVNNALNPDEMLKRISNYIAIECYMFNLAVEQDSSHSQSYHRSRISGLAMAVRCMGMDIYVRHRNDMLHQKIEYFTISYKGEILTKVQDFQDGSREGDVIGNLIEKIKTKTPYLVAYAWLHNAAVREDNGRDVRRMMISFMQCLRGIEIYGVSVLALGSPEIEYITIEHNGRTIMEIDIQEVHNDSETVS